MEKEKCTRTGFERQIPTPWPPPIFFVIGPKGHGKDTVAGAALAAVFGMKKMSCSDSIRPSLAKVWAGLIEQNRVNEESCTTGKLVDFTAKKNPTDWLESKLLEFLNSLPKDPAPGALPHECSRIYQIQHGNYGAWEDSIHWIRAAIDAGAGVITGVRRRGEFIRAKNYFPGQTGRRVVTVWVERPGVPTDGVDNLELTRDDADIVIDVKTQDHKLAVGLCTDLVYIQKATFEDPKGKRHSFEV